MLHQLPALQIVVPLLSAPICVLLRHHAAARLWARAMFGWGVTGHRVGDRRPAERRILETHTPRRGTVRGRSILIAGFTVVMVSCGGETGVPAASPPPTTATAPTTTLAASTTTTAPVTTLAASTTTLDAGFTVTSEDGDVEVDVPQGASAGDPGIVIRLLEPEEYPPELASAAQNPGTRIYNLEPDGTGFAAPVRVTRRIPIENFGDLAATEVPVVYLITRNPEGEYSLLDEMHSMRNGDYIEVSGELSHFSPIISLYGQVKVEITPEVSYTEFATETGSSGLSVDIWFRSDDGSPLIAPDTVDPDGRSRADFLRFDLSRGSTRVFCDGIGEARPRIGSWVDFRVDPEPGQAGLNGPSALIPGVESAPVLMKIAQPFRCLDPETSLVGTPLTLTYQVDHPGGIVGIPGEDFKGGLSALFGTLADSGAFDGGWIGLIGDLNGNGIIDLNDSMLEMQRTEPSSIGPGYVLPLYGYGSYFLYAVDGNSYPDLPAWESRSRSVEDGLAWFADLFTGEGRFETSLGVVGGEGGPMSIGVGSPENTGETEGSIIPLLHDWNKYFRD
mgnify:CR=1 FL=1